MAVILVTLAVIAITRVIIESIMLISILVQTTASTKIVLVQVIVIIRKKFFHVWLQDGKKTEWIPNNKETWP